MMVNIEFAAIFCFIDIVIDKSDFAVIGGTKRL
jgi:hypothetical protein